VKTNPVLVRVRRWEVSVCPLAKLPDGSIAIDSEKRYRHLGSVEPSGRIDDEGHHIRLWTWSDDRSKGEGRTKALAISNMLKANGFHEVPVEATIPDLLSGLTEGES
jgi:hypothetical protein